jgi:hypothetical protein
MAIPKLRNLMSRRSISDDEAKALSRRLSEFGDQTREISAELDGRGYGSPAAVKRRFIEGLAIDSEARDRLRLYWSEYAKERLSCLSGPVNIPRGRYPRICEYRSEFIAKLRDELAKSTVRPEGTIASPQIEPTYKRFVERETSAKQLREMATAIENARIDAASALGLEECAEFTKFIHSGGRDKLCEALVARFSANLVPAGFAVDSHVENGLVCRKSLRGCELDFVLIFQYGGALMTGVLYPMFALAPVGRKVLPGRVYASSVATFSPEVIVPEFYESCAFARDSYAQFCLAVDSIACLCKIAFGRIEKVLSVARSAQ